jgi:hypothetical protein
LSQKFMRNDKVIIDVENDEIIFKKWEKGNKCISSIWCRGIVKEVVKCPLSKACHLEGEARMISW